MGAACALAQPSLPRPAWMENGIIDAGGSHEPYLFMVRRGGQPLDALEKYRHNLSEEVIRKLKQQGVEVFHTHLYKGFGMAAERESMEDAKRAAAIAHRYGMKVDSYIQWNTLMYETFFAEEPRAQNWIQRDALGMPILLKYGFQQSFRYRPCFANQEYLEYLKKIVRYAVEEVKSDFLHFDNFDLNAEPEACNCPVCVRGFRNFLKEKYTPARRRERFGFEVMDYVNPPRWNADNRPERMQVIFDPVIQEWIDYRCQVMADALRQIALYARSMNPEVAIEINPHGITGGNRSWTAGVDHARLLKTTQVMWTEEEKMPAYLPDGRLLSKIRSYKLARAYNNILFTYIAGDPVAMGEGLAFNQTIGFAGSDPLRPEMLRYIRFYREHRDLYNGARDAANVAVLRSYPSLTYDHARAQLSAILLEQTLIQARIPFDLIFDEQLRDLSRYKVLALPDAECLSDGQLAAIRAFVERGGGLFVIGQSGRYDEWRRLRTTPGLAGLVEQQPLAKPYEETVLREREPGGGPVCRQARGGRVAYLPALRFNGPQPAFGAFFEINNRFWKLPRNWQDAVESIRWAAGGELPVRAGGPPFLVINLTAQPARRRVLLHLVNYNHKNVPSLHRIEVRCRLPRGEAVKRVRLYSPDAEGGPIPLKAAQSGAEAAFTVPELKAYAIAAVSW